MTDINRLPMRQREVLEFIIDSIQKNGQSPTIKEIADGNGMILAQAQQIVSTLENKGKIKTVLHKHRSIEVVK